MKILFVTNIPVPYRIDFYNELGKKVDLTVVFEAKGAADQGIKFNYNFDEIKNFKAIFLSDGNIKENKINWTIFKAIKGNYDKIVLTSYSYMTEMALLIYFKFKRVPYYLSSDGGIIKYKEQKLRKWYKTFLISGAKGYFSPSDMSDKYLEYYGAKKNVIYRYPFTSYKKKNQIEEIITDIEKEKIKTKLNIKEKYLVLGVGQFIYRKGWDLLLNAMEGISDEVALCLIGGKPTEEYKRIVAEKKLQHGLWFLQSIFIITIEVAIIIKIAERINGKVLVLRNFFLICVALGNLFIDGIIGVHTANLFVPFVVGYLYAERKFDGKWEINLNKLFLVCSGIVYMILFLFYKEWSFDYISGVNPMTSEYKPYIQMVINIYRWIIGIAGSIVFTEIMQLLYVKYMNLRFVKFVNRIGKETLQIYVMQCFFLEGVISTVVTIVANKLETNILAYNIVCYNTVITLGIAVVYAWLFDVILQVLSKHKIMYKVLFGCA